MAVSAKSDVGKTAGARRRVIGRGDTGPAAAPAASLDAAEKRAGYPRKAQRAPLDFAAITRSVSLAAVLSRYGVLDKLKRRGTRLIGTCPIHQGTNKRQFVVRGDAWHCFGDCNKGGHLLAFVAAMEDCDIRAAGEHVAEWFALFPSPRAKKRRRAMTGNRPSHKVFADTGRPDPNNKGRTLLSNRIGSAWPIKGGAGLSVQLDANSLTGRFVILEFQDSDNAPRTGGKEKE